MTTILGSAEEIRSFTSVIINDFILKIVDDYKFPDVDRHVF